MGEGEVGAKFKSWFLNPALGQRNVVWRMAFLVIVWTVWRCYNKTVFHGHIFNEDGCFELCKFNLAWWIKDE